MKKIASFIMSFLITLTMAAPAIGVAAKSVQDENLNCKENYIQKLSWKDSKTIYIKINDDLNYEATLSTSDESETVSQTGEKILSKKAKISGMFFNSKNKESILTNSVEVKFSYDGQKVFIANPATDIQKNFYTVNENKWKLSSHEEIFLSPNQCVLSQQSNIYKKENWYKLRRIWDYYDNFHIDIICSPTGEVDFNTKQAHQVFNENFTVEKNYIAVSDLGNGVTRQKKTVDYAHIKNENLDKYNYITRVLELLYKDFSGNIIAAAKLEATFRYNKETNEAECLSTAHKEAAISKSDSIKICSRVGNKSRSDGIAYADIELKHASGNKIHDFSSTVKISCDTEGNLATDIF